MPHKPASTALSHITVLDLTRVRSGPTCVRQFADWGANVIKIETPASFGDDGALGSGRASSDFQNLHRNKRSVTIDLKHADGRATFLRMAEKADIVIENFRPDVKNRLGIDYESLKAVNKRIILGSISGFGQDGPDRGRAGFDQIAQGMGGLMSITGEPGAGPMRVGIPIADLTAGLFCAIGCLTALAEREKSGEGQWVQTSLLQAQIFMLDFQTARYLIDDEVPGQAGNNHPTNIPTGVYPTSNGHINIAASGEVFWRRLCESLKTEEWMKDERFDSGKKRSDNRDVLHDMISEITATKSSEHWIDLFTEHSVACGHIYDIGQIFDDPQVQHLGMAAPIETVPFGTARMVKQPFIMSRTPTEFQGGIHGRGEENDEVLAEFGLSEDEIENLRRQNVI